MLHAVQHVVLCGAARLAVHAARVPGQRAGEPRGAGSMLHADRGVENLGGNSIRLTSHPKIGQENKKKCQIEKDIWESCFKGYIPAIGKCLIQ